MKLRRIIGVVIFALASAMANAQQPPDAQDRTLNAAFKYIEAANQDVGYRQYVDILVPVFVQNFRNQRSGASDQCAQTFSSYLRSTMLAHEQDIKLISARAFAHHLSDQELEELTAFEMSDLGKRYRAALAEMISKGVSRPENAKPFIEGVQKAMTDKSADDAVGRRAVVIKGLETQMPPKDITSLSYFFYNGVGKRYTEVAPLVSIEIVQAEIALLSDDAAKLRKQLAESGDCK